MERHILSKSTFIRGVQCLKSLYFYKKRYFLRDPLSAEQQAIFARGTNVGVLARRRFPGGKDATPPSPSQYSRSVSMTSEWITMGVEVIYEAAFQYNKVFIAIDILISTPEGWVGIEVKSSRTISETYILDAALQYHVITGSGLTLADIRIMYINDEYIREGELKLTELFNVQSVLEKVLEKQDFVREQILREKEVIEMPHSPDIAIGLHCHNPYTCDFIGHCRKSYSSPTVFELDAFSNEEQQIFFNQGFHSLEELANEPGLNNDQQNQINSHLTGEIFLDKNALSQFINFPDEPFAFLKVLYFRAAVPLFDGTMPYEYLPFAFAILSSETGTPEFFIIHPGTYPLNELTEQLSAKISKFRKIILMDQTTEVIAFLKKMSISPEVLDMLEPFSKRIIYHPGIADGMSFDQVCGANEHVVNSKRLSIQSDTMAGVRYLALSHALEGEAYSQEMDQISQYAILKVKEVAFIFNWLKINANN